MADTQYTVDIRTQSASVGAAAAQLDQLAGSLQVAGAASSQLEAQLAGARSALDAAAAASAQAAAAVKAGEASYVAQEVAAQRAAVAAERLGQQVQAAAAKVASLRDAETGEFGAGYLKAASRLQQLQARQAEAAARAQDLASALTAEGAALDDLKAAAAAAEAAHEELGQSASALEGKLGEATAAERKLAQDQAGTGKANELAEAFGRMGGPIGMAGQRIFAFTEGLQKMGGAAGAGLGAFVALTAVVVALAAAMAAAVVQTAIWAVKLADTARSAALTTEALSRTSESLSGLGTLLPQVSRETGLAAEQITSLAKKLDDAGVSAEDMPDALRAAAMAEAALGQGGADKLVQDLKEGKKSARELAAEMQKKFGDIVAKKLISLDGTAAKLKANLASTFGGLNIEPLLAGLSRMVGLLDANTASGRAVKFLFESLFQPLVDAASAALPKVERFLLGVAIGALKIYIALKPAIRAVQDFMGAGDEAGIDWLKVGQAAAIGLATAFAAMAVAVAAAAAPFVALYQVGSTAIGGLVAAAGRIREVGAVIASALGGIDLASIGSAMIQGLVSGLLGGLPGVISAMLSLGDAAIAALKSKLSIASPSKVFESFGGFTAEGFQRGVEGGTEDAQGAVDEMVGVPSGGATAPAQKAGGSVSFDGATFNFYGVKDAQQAAQSVREALVDLLTGGSSPAPVAA